MEQIVAQEKQLKAVKRFIEKLENAEHICKMLENAEHICKMLESERYLLNIQDAESTALGNPCYITLLLNEQERAVLAKSIMVVLDFAKQRMERELEKYRVVE